MTDTTTLLIPNWQFKKLIEKIDYLKKGLRLVKINQSVKDVLINDIYGIEGIIKQNKKGDL